MHHHKTAATSCALREKLYLHLSAARSQTGRPTAADLEEISFSMISHDHISMQDISSLIYNMRITMAIHIITWYVLSVLWHNVGLTHQILFCLFENKTI